MKQKLFLFMSLLASLSLYAQVPTAFLLDGDTVYRNQLVCIGDSDTVTVSLTDAIPNIPVSWSVSGDMKKISTASDQRSIEVCSTGPALGGVGISYYYDECGDMSTSFVINKNFDYADYDLEIKGPECVIPGQEVVYSVDPIFTKNLGARIGIDRYIWNIIDSVNELSFVDTIIYVSGDSSAVTFRVGDVSVEPIIRVQVGSCNSNQYLTLALGNSTPRPEFYVDTMYVPVGTESFWVKLKNPNADIDYSWSCQPAASFILDRVVGDSVLVTPSSNARMSDCEVFVTGTYSTITCNTSDSSIYIKRSWGDNVEIIERNGNSCFVVGQSYTFTVSGDVPPTSECEWILPVGWQFANGASVSYRQSVTLTPMSDALVLDSLRVRPRDIGDAAAARSMAVRVQPAPITAISAPACVSIGETNVFSIDTIGITPYADSFRWVVYNVVNGQTDTLYEFTDVVSVSFVATYDTKHISVTPLGKDGCDAPTYVQSLNLPPRQPEGISNDNECLFADKIDTLVLSIDNVEAGQQYGWSLPAGWSYEYLDENNTAVELHTNGRRGSYPVSAWAVGSGACTQSPAIDYTIVVDTILWKIECQYVPFLRQYGITLYYNDQEPEDPQNAIYAYWYVDESETPVYDFSITNSTLPQSIKAVFTVDGCSFTLFWHNPGSIGQRRLPVEEKLFDFTLYPNPASDNFEIISSSESPKTLRLYKPDGKLIKLQKNIGMKDIVNVKDVSEGIYYVVLQQGDAMGYKQLIIKH